MKEYIFRDHNYKSTNDKSKKFKIWIMNLIKKVPKESNDWKLLKSKHDR